MNLGRFHETVAYYPRAQINRGYARVNVIQVKPGSTLTKRVVEELEVENGIIKCSRERDIMYVVVGDRHTGSGMYSVGFIKGLEFNAGAIAQTIAHDTHNLIVAGWNADDMALAVKEVERNKGGIVIVDRGSVVSELRLELAGLMSTEEPETVFERYANMIKLLREKYDMHFEAFFMTLSLVSLPVIPELRITDRGLVDVQNARVIPLVEEFYRR